MRFGRLWHAIYRPCSSGNTNSCEDSVRYQFLRHQSARENLCLSCYRFRSAGVTDSIQGGEYEWLLLNNSSCHCMCRRPVVLWQRRGSIQVRPRIFLDNPVTYTNTVYDCEHSIHSEHRDNQELFTQCSPSDLQLEFCRGIRKCKTKYLSNHSRIQHFSYDYGDAIKYKYPSKQERDCYVTEVCHRNVCGENCLHLSLFLNTLALKFGISCAVRHCRSLTCENETKVEMLTTKPFCSFAFILVGSSETYIYSLYERTEILCLVNITYLWYSLISVKVIHSDGECIRPKRGRTAKQQHGTCVFLCFRSNGFNPALAKPS